ncbi:MULTISPECIES: site-specific integrase [unclassified Pseudodesulfovibrio]|uniref:tyrosine-type recombinase/integrase n=1 Tax=unclassified Pseudodesulfovibrio TaxID=2661612 RepID=UPI000FEB6F19|nr:MULTISPECIES: site-specific integrase [unclassified Pseudodesulfovibrio]MCJ2164687.1 site-specific integrase [Pseudodesulfovibrio sp. S3-i]RWU04121.1 site-specific integrase [Pseudodesulfovibrio sp. S3]
MKTSEYLVNRQKFFSLAEIGQILQCCITRAEADLIRKRTTWPVRYMLVHLALRTGLRVHEIAALRVKDVQQYNAERALFVKKGKRGKPRVVYFDTKLAAHIDSFIRLKEKWGQDTDNHAPLFAGRAGKHFTPTALSISFKNAVKAAGLPDHYSIHCARHTYATHLLAKTNSLRFVQKQLGHASLNMTSLYADLLPEANQPLAELILS